MCLLTKNSRIIWSNQWPLPTTVWGLHNYVYLLLLQRILDGINTDNHPQPPCVGHKLQHNHTTTNQPPYRETGPPVEKAPAFQTKIEKPDHKKINYVWYHTNDTFHCYLSQAIDTHSCVTYHMCYPLIKILRNNPLLQHAGLQNQPKQTNPPRVWAMTTTPWAATTVLQQLSFLPLYTHELTAHQPTAGIPLCTPL